MSQEPEKKKHLVCAIYTRKSTSEGLDQDFSSLDNQRESAENYIKSQQHEGWTASEELYDDGGYTGANIERPALQKLLAHIKEGKINCVVVYKVDRLSRSLLDFSQLLELFDQHGVVFVSITQHFNTQTSMGRLTLNILLSFAQFEREIISERTRDKMGAARKRGQWTGGIIPYGYQRDPKVPKKISIHNGEAVVVKRIFDLYLTQASSALEVAKILNSEGIRTRGRFTKSGKMLGQNKFNVTNIVLMLKNHTYNGKANYKGQIYPGQQPAIIDDDIFKKAQDKMARHRHERKAYRNKDCSGLLVRTLKCGICGSAMVHTYVMKKNRYKYRYYICTNAQKRGPEECPNKYVNAQTIEDSVVGTVKKTIGILKDETLKTERDALLSPVWDTLFFEEKRRVIQSFVKSVSCDVLEQKIILNLSYSVEPLALNLNMKTDHYKTRARKERELINEPSIRKTLLLAHHINKLIDEKQISHPREVCPWINIQETRLDQIMNMLFLSPAIQREILSDNTAIRNLTERGIRPLTAIAEWDLQTQKWQELLSTAE